LLARTLISFGTLSFTVPTAPTLQLAAAVAHSSAHVLGAALEEMFPGIMLTNGPGNADGSFYYEGSWNRCSADLPRSIGSDELSTLDKVRSVLHSSL
jgi:threonyl-tRNA synthetase